MKRKIILRDEGLCNRAAEIVMWMHREDEPHEVIIRPYKSTRSLEQNAYLHKLLADIAAFTGDDLESTKLQMKSLFLQPLARHKLPSGDVYVTYMSTASMNVGQLSEFCEMIQAWAINELGFIRNG